MKKILLITACVLLMEMIIALLGLAVALVGIFFSGVIRVASVSDLILFYISH